MPDEADIPTRTAKIICGRSLMTVMARKRMTESDLAERVGVSEQTIRNYVSSCDERPWSPNLNAWLRVCQALEISPEEVQREVSVADPASSRRGAVADQRFQGDPQNVRSLAGTWQAESQDVEVPGLLSYERPIPWDALLEITQDGASFEVHGLDKDGDGIYARGVLLENGNWVRLDYWVDNRQKREWGVCVLEYQGDGATAEGFLLGRDAGHSNLGLVLAKLRLTRVD